MRIIHFSCVVLMCLAGLGEAAAQDAESTPTVKDILKRLDELYRSKSSRGALEMSITTPHWERTLRMQVWTVGLKKTVIRILSPKKERGVGTLRLGNQMWNYLPKTGKTIRIPPSMMMSSWMGSDFTNDDLVREYTFVEDYTFALAEPSAESEGLILVECRPKPRRPIVWAKVVVAVREADYLPVWQKYYDEKGRVARLLNFSEIKDMDGRVLPTVMEMTPQTKTGHKTTIKYLGLEFDRDLGDELFSLRHLRSRL